MEIRGLKLTTTSGPNWKTKINILCIRKKLAKYLSKSRIIIFMILGHIWPSRGLHVWGNWVRCFNKSIKIFKTDSRIVGLRKYQLTHEGGVSSTGCKRLLLLLLLLEPAIVITKCSKFHFCTVQGSWPIWHNLIRVRKYRLNNNWLY